MVDLLRELRPDGRGLASLRARLLRQLLRLVNRAGYFGSQRFQNVSQLLGRATWLHPNGLVGGRDGAVGINAHAPTLLDAVVGD